jgi:hypothetical protein
MVLAGPGIQNCSAGTVLRAAGAPACPFDANFLPPSGRVEFSLGVTRAPAVTGLPYPIQGLPKITYVAKTHQKIVGFRPSLTASQIVTLRLFDALDATGTA